MTDERNVLGPEVASQPLVRPPGRRWPARKRRAIQLLADRDGQTSVDSIAALVGVKPHTLNRWLARADFRQAIIDRAREDIRACVPAAKRVLLQKALEEGDKECLKIVLRIAGLLDEETATPPRDRVAELRELSDEQLLARVRALQPWTA